ncbi:MAG: hypothetical protein IPL23_18295 [Saprospiraceae bacterium]|nr:hypothetical protein [Saprospiraceae bacterium]
MGDGYSSIGRMETSGFSGIYVSRKINQKLDLFGISSGMAGIIRGNPIKQTH